MDTVSLNTSSHSVEATAVKARERREKVAADSAAAAQARKEIADAAAEKSREERQARLAQQNKVDTYA